jgi:hypothetical protein
LLRIGNGTQLIKNVAIPQFAPRRPRYVIFPPAFCATFVLVPSAELFLPRVDIFRVSSVDFSAGFKSASVWYLLFFK